MKCYIHIGLEKTGTSSLQAFLNANHGRLAKQGFRIFHSSGAKNDWLLSMACYEPWRRNGSTISQGIHSDNALETFQKNILTTLQKEVTQAGEHTAIFSAEDFQSSLTTKEEITRLKDTLHQLGYDDIAIIVYVREPAQLANSRYCELVKGGSTELTPPEPAAYQHLCDHRYTLELWGGVFGKAHIIPRIYEDISTIDDIAKIIGFTIDSTFPRPHHTNTTLSDTGIGLLRHLNAHIPAYIGKPVNEYKDTRAIVPNFINGTTNPARSGLVDFLAPYLKGKPYLMPKALYESYQNAFAESNAWVCAEYFPERTMLFAPAPYPIDAPVALPEEALASLAQLYAGMWQGAHLSRQNKLRSRVKNLLCRLGLYHFYRAYVKKDPSLKMSTAHG